jgi:hypothetical protein
MEKVFELRLRAKKPLFVNYEGEYCMLGRCGLTDKTDKAYVVSKDEIEDQEDDDLYKHSLRSIEERVQQAYTRLVRKGMTTKQIAEALHKTEDEVRVVFSFFSQLDRFEQELLKL